MSQAETQGQRWVKYGANVALSSAVVIALACAAVYLAQRSPKRVDTTVSGIYSLKPQTKAVLREVPGKVRIVSLYSNPETAGKSGDALRDAETERRYAGTVSDLLQEYAKASGNVSVEFIDPGRESDKSDALVKQVIEKYGSELKPYVDFFAGFDAFVPQFKAFAETQSKVISGVSVDPQTDRKLAESFLLARLTVAGLPANLADAQAAIDPFVKAKIPDYRGASGQVRQSLTTLDLVLQRVIADFKALPEGAPESVKAYVKGALPAFEAAAKLVTEQVDKVTALKDLKLDSLREAIKRNTIVVMGDREMRVLGFNDVWKAPDDMRAFVNSENKDKPALKFAGEQQVSTALLAISQPKKPLAIFVRSGGAPLTQSTFRPAQFSVFAQRLKDANFEVVEKDLSGQFAMQAQAQGMPVREATDDQVHDRSAVWVVFSLMPTMTQQGPNPLPGKLKEHLTEGGSAMVLLAPEMDNLETALSDFGVVARTDAILVKKPPTNMAAVASADIVQQAARSPYIFLSTRYGVHPLTASVNGLKGIELPIVPVAYTPAAGRTGTALLPMPSEVAVWGETDLATLEKGGPTFDAGKDIENPADKPLCGGVAVERANSGGGGGTRLVVIGSETMARNQIMNYPDPYLAERDLMVPLFPANAELMANSVFWIARMETMLAISPAAMEVSRIGDIPEGQLAAVRWGVMAGLPLLVVLAGVGVYLVRRE